MNEEDADLNNGGSPLTFSFTASLSLSLSLSLSHVNEMCEIIKMIE